jgi:hypothetical protein
VLRFRNNCGNHHEKLLLLVVFASCAFAQEIDVAKKLKGFEAFMEKVLKDWNAPDLGIGVVSGDKLVFAKGYRDYKKKLRFTAVDAGMPADEGKRTGDKPVRESLPEMRFYNDQLNNQVTLIAQSAAWLALSGPRQAAGGRESPAVPDPRILRCDLRIRDGRRGGESTDATDPAGEQPFPRK